MKFSKWFNKRYSDNHCFYKSLLFSFLLVIYFMIIPSYLIGSFLPYKLKLIFTVFVMVFQSVAFLILLELIYHYLKYQNSVIMGSTTYTSKSKAKKGVNKG